LNSTTRGYPTAPLLCTAKSLRNLAAGLRGLGHRKVGGTIGAVAMDKLNPHHVLGIAYASAGIFVFLIRHASAMPWLMVLAVLGAGFCVSSSRSGNS
jgi:hypothetical protein